MYYYCVLLTGINTMHYCVLCIIIEYYYCQDLSALVNYNLIRLYIYIYIFLFS